jgi:hypothetical protein
MWTHFWENNRTYPNEARTVVVGSGKEARGEEEPPPGCRIYGHRGNRAALQREAILSMAHLPGVANMTRTDEADATVQAHEREYHY